MTYLILFLFGILGALLQSTLLRAWMPAYLIPDLLLLLVLYVSLSLPFGRGIIVSFTLGFLADYLSGAPEGWHAPFFISIFAINKGIQSRIFLKGSRTPLGLFLFDFILKLPYLAILRIMFGFQLPPPGKLATVWLGEVFISLLLMPFIFFLLSKSLGVQRIRFMQVKRSHSI